MRPVIVGAHDTGAADPLEKRGGVSGWRSRCPLQASPCAGGRITPGEWERRRGLRLRFRLPPGRVRACWWRKDG